MKKIIFVIILFCFNLSLASLKNNAIKIAIVGECHFMIDSQTGDLFVPEELDLDYLGDPNNQGGYAPYHWTKILSFDSFQNKDLKMEGVNKFKIVGRKNDLFMLETDTGVIYKLVNNRSDDIHKVCNPNPFKREPSKWLKINNGPFVLEDNLNRVGTFDIAVKDSFMLVSKGLVSYEYKNGKWAKFCDGLDPIY